MGKKHKGYSEKKDYGKEEGFEGTQEELDEYIRVSRPSVVVVVVSLLIALIAVIVWGFIGTLPVTETVLGLVVDTSAYKTYYPDTTEDLEEGRIFILCFVDASRYNGQAISDFGDDVVIKMPDQKTFKGKIEAVSLSPLSREESKKLLFDNEWVTEQCVTTNYNWYMSVVCEDDLSSYVFTLAEVTFVTEEVPPIEFREK